MMLKSIMAVSAIAGFATSAAAQDSKSEWTIGGKVRMDSWQMTTETTPAGGDKATEKSSGIDLNRVEMDFTGKRGDDTLFIRYLADRPELYYATITHKFSDMISATFGKMFFISQSWENDYNGIDQYMYSLASNFVPDNANGAQLDFNFGDHTVSVQALEGVSTVERDDKTVMFDRSGGLSSSVSYRGQINKMIRPLVSYAVVNTTSSKGMADDGTVLDFGNGNHTHMGLGVQADVAGATIDAELDTVTIHKLKDVDGAKDSNVQSLILQAKYPIDANTPFIKVTSDSQKFGADEGQGDFTQTQFALGVEHNLDANCRLHAVFMSSSNSMKNGDESDKMASTGINLGVTAKL